MEKVGDMCGIQSRFFGITGNTLAGFYILMGIIHNRKGENDAQKGDYCQSILLPGSSKDKKGKRMMKGLEC